jgi:hypothetical protein
MLKDILSWCEHNLKSTKPVTGGEDFADSIGLIAIMALVCFVIFI